MKKKLMNAVRRAASAGLSFSCSKQRYYVLFTVLFLLTALLVLSWFFLCGRSLIYETDGWTQYIRACVYYGRYLRRAVRSLLAGNGLQLPGWDPAIGEGADVLGTLHYYGMGEPAALLSALVPTRLMPQFYTFSILLRLYLAGLSFSVLCFGLKIENRFGILAGALSYSFCGLAVRNVARHTVFLQPLITLPLIILGVEKICRKERPYLYVLAVAAAAASNLYFFYMTAVMTAVYALVRLLPDFRTRGMKCILMDLFQLAGLALLGTSLAAVIVLPVLRTLLSDSRMGIDYAGQLLYSRNYYAVLPYVLLTAWNTGNYLCIGLTAPALLACLRLFCRRESGRTERWLLILCGAVILFPFFGRLMNGFSYASNRWCFGLALLSSVILAKNWDGLTDMADRYRRRTLLMTAGLALLCLALEKSRKPASFAMLLLIPLSLQLLKDAGNNALRQLLLCLLAVGNIFAMSLFLFAPGESNLTAESVESGGIAGRLTENEAARIAELTKGTFTRYTGRGLTANAGMMAGVSSTQYYWSLSNPKVNAFRSDLELREMQYQKYTGYDDRTALIALSGSRYYVTDAGDEAGLPFGLKKVRKKEARGHGKIIYEAPGALPFGYCYDTVIDRTRWEQMDAVQKQQSMLWTAFVEGDVQGLPKGQAVTKDYSVPFRLECSSGEIVCGEDSFTVTGDKASVTLTFEGLPDAETYVELQGFDFASFCRYDLYFGRSETDPEKRYGQVEWDRLSRAEQAAIRREKRLWEPKSDVMLEFRSSAKTVKKLHFLTAANKFTSGRSDFIINLGHAQEPQTGVTITFPARGIYRFAGLKVHAVPMEEFRKAIPLLKRTVLEETQIKDGTVRGSITADAPKLLCLPVSWSDGWTAALDGERVPVLLTNGRYLGIAVPAGKHLIELQYHTPWLRAGGFLSLAGLAGFVCLMVFTERKKCQSAGLKDLCRAPLKCEKTLKRADTP